jgi:uncharacterized membrane protein
MIATWMAGNVFWGIMPAQRKFIAAVSEHLPPDNKAMLFAKLRSTHNNYLTLPVIFCMISNHYAFVYGHPYSWLALAAILSLLAWCRHFFNLKHLGLVKPSILVSGFIGLVLVAVVMALTNNMQSTTTKNTGEEDHSASIPTQMQTKPQTEMEAGKIQQIISVHCSGCHSAQPTQPGFNAPPAGLIINTTLQLHTLKVRALPALSSGYMPLGNLNQMSEQERKTLLAWLEQQ